MLDRSNMYEIESTFYTMLSGGVAHSGRGIPLLCRISAEINGWAPLGPAVPTMPLDAATGEVFLMQYPARTQPHRRIISSGSKWTGPISYSAYTRPHCKMYVISYF